MVDNYESDADVSDTEPQFSSREEEEEFNYNTSADYNAEEMIQQMRDMSNDVDQIDLDDRNNYVDNHNGMYIFFKNIIKWRIALID